MGGGQLGQVLMRFQETFFINSLMKTFHKKGAKLSKLSQNSSPSVDTIARAAPAVRTFNGKAPRVCLTVLVTGS